MAVWRARLYRLAIAVVLCAGAVVFGPKPETALTVWSAVLLLPVGYLWAGLGRKVLDGAVAVFAARDGRPDKALSFATVSLAFVLVAFLWAMLADGFGFWISIAAMVPIYVAYALIDWIVRHRDDFDTSLRP